MMFRSVLLAALTAGMIFCAPPQDDRPVSESERSAIEKAVLEANARMTRAAEACDAERLFSFIAENDKGSIIQSGRLLLTRDEAKAQVTRNLRGVAKIAYRWNRQLVTVLSPTTAVLVADGELTATAESGVTFSALLAQTTVFVRSDGEWKILHAHQSSPGR